jgi:hypothetical protein
VPLLDEPTKNMFHLFLRGIQLDEFNQLGLLALMGHNIDVKFD